MIENKKKKDMIAELQRKGFDSDPVKAWKRVQDREAALVCQHVSVLCFMHLVVIMYYLLIVFLFTICNT